MVNTPAMPLPTPSGSQTSHQPTNDLCACDVVPSAGGQELTVRAEGQARDLTCVSLHVWWAGAPSDWQQQGNGGNKMILGDDLRCCAFVCLYAYGAPLLPFCTYRLSPRAMCPCTCHALLKSTIHCCTCHRTPQLSRAHLHLPLHPHCLQCAAHLHLLCTALCPSAHSHTASSAIGPSTHCHTRHVPQGGLRTHAPLHVP